MGAPNQESFVPPAQPVEGVVPQEAKPLFPSPVFNWNPGKLKLFVIEGAWTLVRSKGEAAVPYLMFAYGIGTCIVPIVRLNVKSSNPKDLRPARATAVDGTQFEMVQPFTLVRSWTEPGVAIPPEVSDSYLFSNVSSFFDSKLAADSPALKTRKVKERVKLSELARSCHRKFNVSHVRVATGIPSTGGADIDEMLGVKDKEIDLENLNGMSAEEALANLVEIHPHGGVTMAMFFTPGRKEDGTETIMIDYAVAICSLEDRYCKNLGSNMVVEKMARHDGKVPLLSNKIVNKGGRETQQIHFNGSDTVVISAPHSLLRKVADGLYELASPFFPKGVVLQGVVLSEIAYQMEEFPGGSSLSRILNVIDACKEYLDFQLYATGIPNNTILEDILTGNYTAGKAIKLSRQKNQTKYQNTPTVPMTPWPYPDGGQRDTTAFAIKVTDPELRAAVGEMVEAGEPVLLDGIPDVGEVRLRVQMPGGRAPAGMTAADLPPLGVDMSPFSDGGAEKDLNPSVSSSASSADSGSSSDSSSSSSSTD